MLGRRDKEDKIALLKLARQAGNDFSSARREERNRPGRDVGGLPSGLIEKMGEPWRVS